LRQPQACERSTPEPVPSLDMGWMPR
jgi:hypothetical protein